MSSIVGISNFTIKDIGTRLATGTAKGLVSGFTFIFTGSHLTLLKVFTLLTCFNNPIFVAVDLLNKLHELELMKKNHLVVVNVDGEFPSVEIPCAWLNSCESVPLSVGFPG